MIEDGDLTIEKILEEKKTFDLTVNFERLGANEGKEVWSSPGTALWLRDPIILSPLPCLTDVSLFLNAPNPYEPVISHFHSDSEIAAPSCPVLVRSLPASSNLLHVSIETRKDVDSDNSYQVLLATTADRRMSILQLDHDFTLMSPDSGLQDSPILSHATIGEGNPFSIFAGMSGSVIVYDHRTATIIEERRDHNKYVVKVALCGAGRYLVGHLF